MTEQQVQLRDDAVFHGYWLEKRAEKVLSQHFLSGRDRIDALCGGLHPKGSSRSFR